MNSRNLVKMINHRRNSVKDSDEEQSEEDTESKAKVTPVLS